MANKSRPKQLSFRVSEEEWELLQQKIAESGMNQQQYILSCVFGKAIINTDGIKAVVPELKQQGANLNQIGQKLSVTLNDLSSVWQSLGAALQTVRVQKNNETVLHDPRVPHHCFNGKLRTLVDRAHRYAAAETLSAAFPTTFSFNHGILTDFLAFHQIRRTK